MVSFFLPSGVVTFGDQAHFTASFCIALEGVVLDFAFCLERWPQPQLERMEWSRGCVVPWAAADENTDPRIRLPG